MKDKKIKESFKIFIKTLKLIHSLDGIYFLLVVLESVFKTARYFVTLVVSAMIIDELLGAKDVERFVLLVGIIIGVNFLLSIGTQYCLRVRGARTKALREKLHKQISTKILTLDFEYIDNPILHNLRQKYLEYDNMSGTVYAIVRNISSLFTAVTEIIVSVALTVSLFTTSLASESALGGVINSPYWVLMLVALIAVMVIIYMYQSKKTGQLQMDGIEKAMWANRIGLYLQNDLCGEYKYGKDLRMYDTKKLIRKFNDIFVYGIREFIVTFYNKSGLLNAVGIAISGIFTGAIYVFVVLKAFVGAITVGSIMKYVGAIQKVSGGITSLMNSLMDMQVSSEFQKVLHDILELPDLKYHGTLPVEKRSDHEYEVEFRKVSFKYPATDEYALKNVSFKLNIGERLAVVGMNGAGKTTMIKLLCRLYDPTEGEILLNGINIKKYDYDEYMSLFSVVFQDFKMFSFSMEQNVASSIVSNADRVEECVVASGLNDRLDNLKDGLKTSIYKDFDENGVDFSGGELQKLAIARALYKDAPIIILDEPTASLDPISEFEIYSRFDGLVGSKTAIYISHRLSSCRFCHDIMVFDKGEIIQRGTHEELHGKKRGKYHELWEAQAQYYR